jgi:hypothetical protein
MLPESWTSEFFFVPFRKVPIETCAYYPEVDSEIFSHRAPADMHIQRLAALAAVASVSSASAVLPRLPKETGVFQFPFDQITPIPTSAPEIPLELVRRADDKTTVLVGPDNLCGYISDSPGASFFCPAGFNCILFPPQSTLSGEVACCNPGSCNLRLTCLDLNQISTSSSCDNRCKVDPFTLKW